MKQDRIEIRADGALLSAINAWRRKQEDLPGKSEAVRRLLLQALAADAPAARPAETKRVARPRPPPAVIADPRQIDVETFIATDKPARKPAKASPAAIARAALRKRITAAPGWKAYSQTTGLKIDSLGTLSACEKVAADLGLAV